MKRPRGRPPLGKQAMSGAERQRRYLERLLKGAETDTALKTELAQAKKRIAELEVVFRVVSNAIARIAAKGSVP
jgi:anthranilate/para-aminobenzoate synthase component I